METKRDIRRNRVEYENPISKTTENIFEGRELIILPMKWGYDSPYGPTPFLNENLLPIKF